MLVIGVAQFMVFMVVAETLYPGYSVSSNYISDLGVGPSSGVFNVSVSLLGILVIVAGALVMMLSRGLGITAILAGIGALGVGVFPENTGTPHTVFSLVVFLFGAVASYFAGRVSEGAGKVLWPILGTAGLISLILYVPGNLGVSPFNSFLGLGRGGLERMIAYPELLWALGFGASAMGSVRGKELIRRDVDKA